MLWELFPQEMTTDVLLFIIGPPTADQNTILLTLVRGHLQEQSSRAAAPRLTLWGRMSFVKMLRWHLPVHSVYSSPS